MSRRRFCVITAVVISAIGVMALRLAASDVANRPIGKTIDITLDDEDIPSIPALEVSEAIANLEYDRYLFSLAQYEIEVRELRRGVLRSWRSEASSDTRYSLFLLAVMLPPFYVCQSDGWRWSVLWSAYGPECIDVDDLAKWRVQYSEMKRHFLDSVNISDADKNLLVVAATWSALRNRHSVNRVNGVIDGEFIRSLRELNARFSAAADNQVLELRKFLNSLFVHLAWSVTRGGNPYVFSSSEIVEIARLGEELFPDHQFLSDWFALALSGQDPETADDLRVSAWPGPEKWDSLTMPYTLPWNGFGGESNDPSETAKRIHRALHDIRGFEVGLRLWQEADSISVDSIGWVVRAAIMNEPVYWESAIRGAGFESGAVNSSFEEGKYADIEAIKEDILSSEEVSFDDKKMFEHGVANRQRLDAVRSFSETGNNRIGQIYLGEMLRLYTTYGRRENEPSHTDIIFAVNLMNFYASAGLTVEDAQVFLSNFSNSTDDDLWRWSKSLSNLLLLKEIPLSLESTTIDGDEFSLSSFHGNAIFLDFWSTTCSTCIENMPKKKEIYERFKDRGLVAVSVAVDYTKYSQRVRRVVEENELDWITIDGGEIWRTLNFDYGIWGVPQYMVLDQQGLMIGSPPELRSLRDVEGLLEGALYSEPSR